MTRYFLTTNNKAVHRAALLISILAISVSSCRKADDQVGVDFLPKDNNFSSRVIDTIDVTAYTIAEDSIKIDSLSRQIVGAINDAEFGTTSANLYTQILLREINVDFGTSPVIDSVVLSLAKNASPNNYGNPNSSITLDIFRMGEIIEKSKSYYSTYSPALSGQIGTWTGNLQAQDTAWFMEDNNLKFALNTIRIPLDNSFGEDFFTNGQFGSNQVFLNYLNGIALIPNTTMLGSNEGNYVSINKNSDDSKLIIYYNGGLRKEFDMNSESQNISTYTSTNLNSNIQTQLDNGKTHYNKTYLQSMGVCKTKFDIPQLYDWAKDQEGIVINEATITVSVDDASITEGFEPPTRLLLLQPSEVDSSNAFILDLIDVLIPPSQSWLGHTVYGGNYDETTKSYTFGFTRHLQSLIDTYNNTGEDKNRGFYLIIPSDNPITPSRLILNTDQSGSVKNINLKITYTKL